MTLRIAFLLILQTLPCLTFSQSLTNTSTISISPNAVLFIKQDLTNNGLIVNNGDMQIGGAWQNNSQYDAGVGKITFNSNLPQTINHNAQSFSRLTISGGGVKNFNADITVEDELDLQSGELVSQNGAKIYFTPSANIIGGSDDSHINGPVYQQGSGDKLFPMGNGTIYLPVMTTGIDANAEVGIILNELSTPSLNKSKELAGISSTRYWELDVASGDIAGARITLPIRDEGGLLTDITRALVAESSSLTGDFKSMGQSAVTGDIQNGTVTSSNAPSGPFLAIGALSDSPQIIVYNAVSPNEDGLNDFMRIGNIEFFENNVVQIFNRWGDKVFEISKYDNDPSGDNVFRGYGNVNGKKELVAGTYFYLIDKGDGSEKVSGYVSLKK